MSDGTQLRCKISGDSTMSLSNTFLCFDFISRPRLGFSCRNAQWHRVAESKCQRTVPSGYSQVQHEIPRMPYTPKPLLGFTGCHCPLPVQPNLPAIGHGVGNINVHDAGSLPNVAATKLPSAGTRGHGSTSRVDDWEGNPRFPVPAGTRNSHFSARLHKPRQVVQVQIVGRDNRWSLYRQSAANAPIE